MMVQPEKAARIVEDAGGRVLGMTRLQKTAYFLELALLGEGFQFEYRHYGPYSDQLATALANAKVVGLIQEDERTTSWGGSYFIYSSKMPAATSPRSPRAELISLATSADPISLELAATAAFLATEGIPDPWRETARRKPEKAVHLECARALYTKLCAIETPRPLPPLGYGVLQHVS